MGIICADLLLGLMVAASNVILFESTLMQKMYKENEEMEIKEIKKYNN